MTWLRLRHLLTGHPRSMVKTVFDDEPWKTGRLSFSTQRRCACGKVWKKEWHKWD